MRTKNADFSLQKQLKIDSKIFRFAKPQNFKMYNFEYVKLQKQKCEILKFKKCKVNDIYALLYFSLNVRLLTSCILPDIL